MKLRTDSRIDLSPIMSESALSSDEENMRNIHQQAIESVAKTVSSDPDICLLVNKFRASLGKSKSPKDTLSLLFEDEVLGKNTEGGCRERRCVFYWRKQKFSRPAPVPTLPKPDNTIEKQKTAVVAA